MSLRKFIATGLAVFAALYVVARCTVGCIGLDPVLSPQEQANISYKAQQAACVDQYADRPSIDKCRKRVQDAWAADAGADASSDAGKDAQ